MTTTTDPGSPFADSPDGDSRARDSSQTVVLGLGANSGHPQRNLSTAIGALGRWLRPLHVSPLYRSHPVSQLPQPDYFNLVVLGRTELAAEDLLAVLKALEHRQGRRQDQRNSPRPLDIDLLLHGQRICHRPELTLPHPRLRQRRFALAPLVDLAPDLPLPPDGCSAASVLHQLGAEAGGHAEPVPWPPDLDPNRPAPG